MMKPENEDRAGKGYGGYRQDAMWSGGAYISQEFIAAKDFLFPDKTLKQTVQIILDTWGKDQCITFNLTPRELHKVSPKLDKTS